MENNQDLKIIHHRLLTEFGPGGRIRKADLFRVIFPDRRIRVVFDQHADEIARIAEAMVRAGMLIPSVGPRGGAGWMLQVGG